MFRIFGLAIALSLASAPVRAEDQRDDEQEKKEDEGTVVVTKDGKKRKVLTFDEEPEDTLVGREHKPSVEFIEGRPDLTDDSIDLTVPETVGGRTVERRVPKSSSPKKTETKVEEKAEKKAEK